MFGDALHQATVGQPVVVEEDTSEFDLHADEVEGDEDADGPANEGEEREEGAKTAEDEGVEELMAPMPESDAPVMWPRHAPRFLADRV